MIYQYTLPFSPSVNHYWFQKGNRRFIGSKGVQFRKDVLQIVGNAPKLEGRLKILIDVYPPDRRTRDLDNLLKAPLDAMQHALVFLDDNQFDDIQIRRKEIIKPGHLIITIMELDK